MNCVKCGEATNVSTTYQNSNNTTRRRRICLHCDFRFTTRENAEEADVQRAEKERGSGIVAAVAKNGLGRKKGVDRLSHAWYNPSPTNDTITSIED
jgi:transcription elongation factor Elf1